MGYHARMSAARAPILSIEPDSPWLAPLAGYTDLPFRLLCRDYGAKVTVTEMISAKSLVLGGARGKRHLLASASGDEPVVAQLFGSEPELMAEGVRLLMEQGFRYFDVNAGCPVPKVAKSRAGSIMLEDVDNLVAVATAMVQAAGAGAQVGVKTRTGWWCGKPVFLDAGRRLEDAGVSWLTLHPRFGKQMFTGQADWSRLAELKAAVGVPVVASGDLFTGEDGARCIAETGVDAVMFARGALANPAVFDDFARARRGQPARVQDGPFVAAMIRRHVDLCRVMGETGHMALRMRTLVPRYVRGLAGAKALRARLIAVRTLEELLDIVPDIEALGPADAHGRAGPGPDLARNIA